MKVALLYYGLVRTLADTWPAVQTCFAPYTPDLYFYLNEPAQEPAVRALIRPTLLLAEPDHKLPEKNYHSRIGPGVNDIQNDLRQMHGLLRVNALRKSTGIAYDWIVRLRADLFFTRSPAPLSELSPHAVYLPGFSNFFGYNDRFAFGPPHLMDIYMDRFTTFDDYFTNGGEFHMESFLAWTVRKNQIPIARTTAEFDTLRLDGTRVPPFRHRGMGDTI